MKTFKKDKLTVEIYENRTLMGEAAAKDIKAKIAELLSQKSEINMIFAALVIRAWIYVNVQINSNGELLRCCCYFGRIAFFSRA